MDTISFGMQATAVLLGCGKSIFKDESRIFGIGGRMLARTSLISSVGLLASDQLRIAYTTGELANLASGSVLSAITARAVVLAALPNETRQDKLRRQFVANAAFVTGTAVSVAAQYGTTGSISILPTILTGAALWIGGQMDRQAKQEDATRLLVTASLCWVPVAVLSGSWGLFAKTAVLDVGFTSLNIYRNFVRDRYEGTPVNKVSRYIADSAREVAAAVRPDPSRSPRKPQANRPAP